MRYLALGDSYSIGEGVQHAERWPMLLAARLRRAGVPLDDPLIVARTGWTTDELAAAMDTTTLAPPYDLVSLSIGVNNQYRGRDLDHYRHEFRGLLARAVRLAGGNAGRVIVVSIPDWGVTPFARNDARGAARIGQQVDAFNEVNRQEAARAGTAWIDVAPLSRQSGEDWLVADELHPSARQYAHWVDRIEPIAVRMLGAG